jgi:hypothetical protein
MTILGRQQGVNDYEKVTRSYVGKPGKKYWQNTVDYKIQVNVIPEEKLIEGTEEVVYHIP